MKNNHVLFGLNQDVTRLLMRTGMLCSETERHDEADSLYRAVARCAPGIPHPIVCLAMGLMYRGKAFEAVVELQQTIAEFPDSQIAKALLGMALRECGQPQWEDVLLSVLEDDRDEWAVSLASSVLAYRGTSVHGSETVIVAA
jgi:hypothetical protein